MSDKRALVVDDSKLARFVLKEMLVEQGFLVDTAESAEESLKYLGTARPDVIFMDHIMPGMDGFAAVRAIKKIPTIARIPVLMYTSKEGDVYSKLARTVGAFGVLPKQLKPAQLISVLGELSLLPGQEKPKTLEVQDEEIFVEEDLNVVSANSPYSLLVENKAPAEEKSEASPAVVEVPVDPFYTDSDAHEEVKRRLNSLEELAQTAVESIESKTFLETMKRLLEEQRHQLHRDFEISSHKIIEIAGKRISDADRVVDATVDPDVEHVPLAAKKEKFPSTALTRGVVAVAIALLPAMWFSSQYDSASQELRKVTIENQRLKSQPNGKANELATDSGDLGMKMNELKQQALARSAVLYRTIEWAINSRNTFDYAETPFGNRALQTLTTLLSHLGVINFSGTVKMVSHLGDFCLVENKNRNGWMLPPDNMPISKCKIAETSELVSVSAGEKQTIEFGNYLSSLDAKDSIQIIVTSMGNQAPLIPYPTYDVSLKAGDWNRIARRNNRIEVAIISAKGEN